MNKVFPERLRKLRIENGYTMDETAKKLNLKYGNYKELEKSSRKYLPPEVAEECARLYHTSLDYIYGKTDNPNDLFDPQVLDEIVNRRVQSILENGHNDSIKYT